jgi:pyridoxine kinase
MIKALTIAGSDTSGGAGMQADLKTFQEYGVYGMSALTVLVAQNPHNNWSHEVFPLSLDVVAAQLETVLTGIRVDAVKTGMLPTAEIISLAAQKIKQSGIRNIVIDPVMVCKGTDEVVNPQAATCIREKLAPIATIITPNLFEAKQLSGVKQISSVADMQEAAKRIHSLGPQYVLIKGGAKLGLSNAVDILYDGKSFELLESPKLDTSYTHGAGCTYAAAITAGLAKGESVLGAVNKAKRFVTAAIEHGFPLNSFVGAVNHCAIRLLSSH